MKKIGIFGGTFDPIHIGHLIIAQEVSRLLKLSKVIFVPAFIPPHKKRSNPTSANDRYKMVQMAIRNNAKFEASTIEIKRRGKSYSVDTLRKLRKKFGSKASLFFIIGSDMVKDLKSWKELDSINKIVKFIAVKRSGYPVVNLPKNIDRVNVPQVDVSSTQIRRLIKNGHSINFLVPDVVRKYISDKYLYLKN